jgi:hypothetical protein
MGGAGGASTLGGVMKTWRERIAQARERGKFNNEDWSAWVSLSTCPAGELVKAYPCLSEPSSNRSDLCLWNRTLHGMGNDFEGPLAANDFDAAERLLDAMEDRALQLKLEQGT